MRAAASSQKDLDSYGESCQVQVMPHHDAPCLSTAPQMYCTCCLRGNYRSAFDQSGVNKVTVRTLLGAELDMGHGPLNHSEHLGTFRRPRPRDRGQCSNGHVAGGRWRVWPQGPIRNLSRKGSTPSSSLFQAVCLV